MPPSSQLLKGNLICRSSAGTALGYDMRKWKKKKSKPKLCPSVVLRERAGVGQGQSECAVVLGLSKREENRDDSSRLQKTTEAHLSSHVQVGLRASRVQAFTTCAGRCRDVSRQALGGERRTLTL